MVIVPRGAPTVKTLSFHSSSNPFVPFVFVVKKTAEHE